MVVWMVVIAVLELSRSEDRISSRFENTGVGFSTIVVEDTADSNSNVLSSNVVRDSEVTYFLIDVASSIYYHHHESYPTILTNLKHLHQSCENHHRLSVTLFWETLFSSLLDLVLLLLVLSLSTFESASISISTST